jgi:hypothetical protein
MNIPSGLLKVGSRGKLVTDLQRELKEAGFDPHGIDGEFGPKTAAALKAFQRSKHIAVDGIAGKQTWTALGGDRYESEKPTKPVTTPNDGADRLYGADTSHWQSSSSFESSIKGAKWSAIKATEGTGYTDPTFKARWKELGDKIEKGDMKLRVAYHFMSAGNGVAQAKHFLSELGIKGKLAPGTRLCLDWEAGALKDPKALHDAASYIHDVTGTWPMVYCSASQLAAARKQVPNAPMWEAKWTGGKSVTNVPFVQYADGPTYDRDFFNGDLKDLERFAGWIN